MKRFKQEKYIRQRYSESSNIWTFQVFIREYNITKTFSQNKYGSAKTTYEAAIAYRDKCLNDARNEGVFKTKKTTLKKVFEESLEMNNFLMKTKLNHQSLFNKFVKCPNLPLEKFDSLFVIKTLNDMSTSQNNDTINRMFSIFKDIDKAAMLLKYYSIPVTYGITPPKSHLVVNYKEYELINTNTYTQVKSVLEKRLNGPHDKLMLISFLEMLLYTGMRPSECLALHKTDIKDDWIIVDKQFGSSKEQLNVIRNTKTENSNRIIPVAKELSPTIKTLLENDDNELLFHDENGSPYIIKNIGGRFNNICKRNGLDFNMYQLRHLFQTDLEYSGVDRKTIDMLAGHANKDSTDVYVHSNKKKMREAIDKRVFDASLKALN